MAGSKIGYYRRDTGQSVYDFYMSEEPPLGQFLLRDGTWEPLADGYFLMDMVIDGNPELTGPVKDPPQGVPPYRS
jgi:hypothetical protein